MARRSRTQTVVDRLHIQPTALSMRKPHPLGHSSLTVSADVHTSLLPEFARAIAERAALLVPRAGRQNGPNGAPPSEALAEPVGSSAHASLTQTAPDMSSKAVW